MTAKHEKSIFHRMTFWKIWFLLIAVLAVYLMQDIIHPGTMFSQSGEQSVRRRFRTLQTSVEDHLFNHDFNALNELANRLREETSPPDRILEEWLNTRNGGVAVSLWLKERLNPIRLIQKGFWSKPEVAEAGRNQRRALLAYLFPDEVGIDTLSQAWFGVRILEEDVLGYPLYTAGIKPADTWVEAIELVIDINHLYTDVPELLESEESLTLLDGNKREVFAFGDQSVSAPEKHRPDQIIWEDHGVSIGNVLDPTAWTLLYFREGAAKGPAVEYFSNSLFRVAGFGLFLSFLLAIIITFWIDRPLKRLINDATDIARGEFILRVDRQQDRNLNRLAQIFNYMAEEMEHLQGLDVGEIINEKNKTETVLRNIADGVVVTGPEDGILVMNTVAEDWFGLQEKAIFRKPIADYIRNQTLLNLIENVKKERAQSTAEFVLRPLGSREDKVFQVHAARVNDPEDKLVGVVMVIRDVTKEREADRIKTELVSMVAHELKSPLTSIYGFSELLLESNLEDPQTREYAKVILTESTRLTDLVNKFLDLSRLEAGRTEIRLSPFDIEPVVDKIIDTYGSQAKKKEIRVIAEIPEDIPLALGDPDMIEQVLLNLFSNAVKYSPRRSKVGIEVKEVDNAILVSVIDNGYGIPKEALPKIFDKFYRVVDTEEAEDGEEVEGSGLGLTLAKVIVEQHGGTLKVNSSLGVGSVFSFTIPKSD